MRFGTSPEQNEVFYNTPLPSFVSGTSAGVSQLDLKRKSCPEIRKYILLFH